MNVDLALALIIAAVFLLAGFVKGVVGMGLPTVALGLLALAMPLPQAMALMVLPSLATNVWQALTGGHLAAVLARIWPLLLGICLGTAAGAALGMRAGPGAGALLGAVLVLYAVFGLSRVPLRLPQRLREWLAPVAGLATGTLTVATGVFVVPAVPYLQSLGLARDALVQALGLSFTVSTLALALVLADGGAFSHRLVLLSAAALVPAALGVAAGQRARKHLSPERFRMVFFFSLLVLGLYLLSPSLTAA